MDSEFAASLVYRVSSRTARTMQRNPVSKNKQTNKQTKPESPAQGDCLCVFVRVFIAVKRHHD